MTDQPGAGAGQPVAAPTCYRHPDRETYIRCQRCGKPICPDCMRDASVGFQCPDCVSIGARETRQGRTAYGGRRPSRPGIVSLSLIGINAAVFVAVLLTGGTSSRLVDLLALRPNGLCLTDQAGYDISGAECTGAGATWLPGVIDGAYWQLLTSAFTHAQLFHIGFNLLAVWFLGPQLELVLGRLRFLVLYLVSALAGSVVVLWFSGEYVATLGASGAVFGLLGALIVVALKVHGDATQLLMWLAVNAVITFTVPNVSWQGHLGGLVGGTLVALAFVYAPKERRTFVQSAGVAAVGVALVVAAIARVAMLA